MIQHVTITQKRGVRRLDCELHGRHITVFNERLMLAIMSGVPIALECHSYPLGDMYTLRERGQ